MDKEQELYLEEQRQSLIKIDNGIKELIGVLSGKVSLSVQPIEKVDVTGTVSINNDLDIKNIELIKDWLMSLGEIIERAIRNNSYKPEKNVIVENIEKAKPTELKINNLDDIREYFADVAEVIKQNQPIVNIEKQEVVFPTSANNPIAVRLSDGKSFYRAVAQLVAAGGSQPDKPIDAYAISDIDETTSTSYFGFLEKNGAWYIMKMADNSGVLNTTYAVGDSNYNFSNRALLNYSAYDYVF